MRRKLKRAMLLLLSALAALLMLVGCELGMTKEQALSGYDLKASVTYYANGGDFGNGNTTKEIWYKANSRPLNIGVDPMPSGTSINLKYDKHDFVGWYHVAVDQDGNLLIGENGQCTLDMEKPVDFSTAVLLEDDAWHLGALWNAKAKVRVRLVSDGVITDKKGTEFDPASDTDIKVSDYLSTNDYKTQLDVGKSPIDLASGSAYQFVGYYFDQAATQPILEELRQQEGQTEDVIIYAKYISKEWTVVKSTTDVKNMIMLNMKTADKKFYIARDIDMSTVDAFAVSNGVNLAATIEGNGFTISNLSIKKTKITTDFALFGNVKSTAVIRNLTFDNLVVEYGLNSSVNVYFVCLGIEDGATVENVTISGSMEIGGMGSARNFENDFNSCMFGVFATDEMYETAHPNGFKVEGLLLKYQKEEITIK